MIETRQIGIGATRAALLLIALVAFFSIQPGNTFGQAHTFEVSVKSGQDAKLRHAINIDRRCRKMATPTVQILTPPSNGTVTVRQGSFVNSGPRRFINIVCPETVLPGVGIYYKSNRGFRGSDQVTFRLFYETDRKGQKTWDETVNITVQ